MTTGDNNTPLVGANVYWLGTTIGVATDENGHFRIDKTNDSDRLVVSYIGYQNDTIDVTGKETLDIQLKPSVSLEEVEVVHRKKSTEISYMNTISVKK